MRRGPVITIAALLAGVAGITLALEAPKKNPPSTATFIQDVVAGEQHTNGDARWNSVVLSRLSSTCWLTGPERRQHLGAEASAEPRANRLDCMGHSAWVDNTGQTTIRCKASLKLNEPDDSGRKVIVDSVVVPPGAMLRAATAYTEEANRPASYHTDCEVASESDLASLPPADCRPRLASVVNPAAFYPESLKARNVSAAVLIDARVDATSQKLRDIFVDESSRHRDLDIAALKVAALSRTEPQDCGARRIRFRIKFAAPEPSAPAPNP